MKKYEIFEEILSIKLSSKSQNITKDKANNRESFAESHILTARMIRKLTYEILVSGSIRRELQEYKLSWNMLQMH